MYKVYLIAILLFNLFKLSYQFNYEAMNFEFIKAKYVILKRQITNLNLNVTQLIYYVFMKVLFYFALLKYIRFLYFPFFFLI